MILTILDNGSRRYCRRASNVNEQWKGVFVMSKLTKSVVRISVVTILGFGLGQSLITVVGDRHPNPHRPQQIEALQLANMKLFNSRAR